MRLWIDLANSPHVPFFRALANRFAEQGHEIEVTAREFAETIPLARAAGFQSQVVGAHAGRAVSAKAGGLVSRAWALAAWAVLVNTFGAVSFGRPKYDAFYSHEAALGARRPNGPATLDLVYPPD